MFFERTSVGLDVHARSVVAEAVDWSTGQVFSQRLVPANDVVLAWVRALPAPVAVAYEAGPTGFGLARALTAAGIACVVVAPSKLERPPGDRVKTDRRDARRLAHLLHIGEVPAVRVPTVEEESARDLVRAREDARGDLMRARHRVSKLLLRHGIVYSDGVAWTQLHQVWLRRQHFDSLGVRTAYGEALDAVIACEDRRDRLDAVIDQTAHDGPWAGTVARLECVRGIATLTAFGLATEVGDWQRFTGATIGGLPRPDPHRVLQRVQPLPGVDHQGRQHPRPQVVGRGRLAPPQADALRAEPDHPGPTLGRHPRRARPSPRRRRPPAPPLASARGPQEATHHRRRRRRPRAGRMVLEPGRHGGLNPRPGPPTHKRGRWRRRGLGATA
jgi:transposase